MFWRLDLASCWRLTSVVKNTCLAKTGTVFKSFSVFPRTFCDCSSSLSTVSFPTLRVTHFKLHCCFISSQNHQEKVWVFSSSLHMLWFVCYFLAIWVVIFVILYSIFLLFVCWVWWIVLDADFIWYCFVGHNVLILCSVLWLLLIFKLF